MVSVTILNETLMRKVLTAAIGIAIPLLLYAQGKAVPYSSAIGNDSEWTVVNVEDDSMTWELLEKDPWGYADPLSETGYEYGMKYGYDVPS